jgi:hypothetical protein
LTSPIVLVSGTLNDDFIFLYGIDDEDDDDANIDFVVLLLMQVVLIIFDAVADYDSLCYSNDDEDDNDALSIFSCASSAASVLPVVECAISLRCHSSRMAAMEPFCYKKLF